MTPRPYPASIATPEQREWWDQAVRCIAAVARGERAVLPPDGSRHLAAQKGGIACALAKRARKAAPG